MITDTEPGQTLDIKLKDWFRQDAKTLGLVADLHSAYRQAGYDQVAFDGKAWALVDHICEMIGGDHLVIKVAQRAKEAAAPAEQEAAPGIPLDETYFVNSLLEALIKAMIAQGIIPKAETNHAARLLHPIIEDAVARARVDMPGHLPPGGDLPTALARLRVAQDETAALRDRYAALSNASRKAALDRTLDMVEFRNCLGFCLHALTKLKDDWEADSSGDHAELALGMIDRFLERTATKEEGDRQND